jgi:hypothetical protein
MKLASKIVVRQIGAAYREDRPRKTESLLQIDGKDFPFYLTEEGVQPRPARRGELPGVTITIPADRVEFVHDLAAPQAKERRWWHRLRRKRGEGG